MLKIPRVLLVALPAMTSCAWSAERADVGKGRVEFPARFTVWKSSALQAARQSPAAAAAAKADPDSDRDRGKRRIEGSTRRLVAERAVGAARSDSASRPSTSDVDNPKVEPGKVRWHESFEAACAASRKSRKPVLLFQLMGNLDDRFC